MFIMSHSFTRSEKEGVWESLRPFRRALTCPLMDFIEPKGDERNSVYLKAALWALKCCSVFIPLPLCLHSARTTKTFDPSRRLRLPPLRWPSLSFIGSPTNNFPVKQGGPPLTPILACFLVGICVCFCRKKHAKQAPLAQ